MESYNYEIDQYKPIGIKFMAYDGITNEYYKEFIDEKYNTILGTIQKSNGQVTTSISDEVLEGLVDGKVSEWFNIVRIYYNYQRDKWTFDKPLESFISRMGSQGITLKEGEKKAILKIKY